MKRIAILASAVLAVGLASGLYAQDNAAVPALVPGASTPNTAHGWSTTGANVAPGGNGIQSSSTFTRYSQLIKVCGLSEEQQNEIRSIEAERDKITQAHYAEIADKLKAAQAAISEANKSRDKDAIQKATAEYRDLMEPVSDFHKSAQAKIMALLTAEQKALWQEYQILSNVKSLFFRAKLTEEQVGQLKAAYAELAKDKDAKDEDIVRKLSEQARSLLTDEQKESMKSSVRFNASGGTLTPGATINVAPNPATGVQIQSNGILLQGQNGNMAPGTVTGSAVFIVGEGGDSGSGTFVQEGAGSTVHVIQGANGAVGTITIRVEQSDK